MDAIKYFEKNSYVIIKDIIPKEVTKFLYNYFIMKGCTNQEFGSGSADDGISVKSCYGDLNTETLCSFLNPTISHYTKKDLCPTYTYSRIYIKGMDLKAHRDRPSCEYSMTLNLGGDPWPIYFGDRDDNSDYHYLDADDEFKKLKILNKENCLLEPGDAAIYMGEKLWHWREPFKGDHCVQTFLHYIDKEGPHYPEHSYDGRPNLGFIKKS